MATAPEFRKYLGACAPLQVYWDFMYERRVNGSGWKHFFTIQAGAPDSLWSSKLRCLSWPAWHSLCKLVRAKSPPEAETTTAGGRSGPEHRERVLRHVWPALLGCFEGFTRAASLPATRQLRLHDVQCQRLSGFGRGGAPAKLRTEERARGCNLTPSLLVCEFIKFQARRATNASPPACVGARSGRLAIWPTIPTVSLT